MTQKCVQMPPKNVHSKYVGMAVKLAAGSCACGIVFASLYVGGKTVRLIFENGMSLGPLV